MFKRKERTPSPDILTIYDYFHFKNVLPLDLNAVWNNNEYYKNGYVKEEQLNSYYQKIKEKLNMYILSHPDWESESTLDGVNLEYIKEYILNPPTEEQQQHKRARTEQTQQTTEFVTGEYCSKIKFPDYTFELVSLNNKAFNFFANKGGAGQGPMLIYVIQNYICKLYNKLIEYDKDVSTLDNNDKKQKFREIETILKENKYYTFFTEFKKISGYEDPIRKLCFYNFLLDNSNHNNLTIEDNTKNKIRQLRLEVIENFNDKPDNVDFENYEGFFAAAVVAGVTSITFKLQQKIKSLVNNLLQKYNYVGSRTYPSVQVEYNLINYDCVDIQIDLYDLFIENKFGPLRKFVNEESRINQIKNYYNGMMQAYNIKSNSNKPLEFFFKRDQLKWYFCYRLHFLIDSFHDFFENNENNNISTGLKLLISNFQTEIKELNQKVLPGESIFITKIEEGYYVGTTGYSDIKEDEEEMINLLNNHAAEVYKQFNSADKQRNFTRWILNDCFISTRPKPWGWYGTSKTPGPDVLSIYNHGYKPNNIDSKNILNIFGVDSAGNISRNTDIATILDAYSDKFSTQNAVVVSLASKWDGGGNKNSIFNGKSVDANITDTSGNLRNLKIHEYFQFRPGNYKHEVIDYCLLNVNNKAILLLKQFGNVKFDGYFMNDTSVKEKNKENINTVPRDSDNKLIVGYFMSKLLGDESKINVLYAVLSNQIQFKINEDIGFFDTEGSVLLSYWVSNDIIASMSAGFKIPGTVIVETADEKLSLELYTKKESNIKITVDAQKSEYQRWAIRDWCFKELKDYFVIQRYSKNLKPDNSQLLFGKKKATKSRFIKKVVKRSQRKGTQGSFTRWCKTHHLTNSSGKITQRCISKALKSKNLVTRRRAQFAKNIYILSVRSKQKGSGSRFGLHRPTTRKSRTGKKFIQEVFRRSQRKGTQGSFTRWCKSRGLLNKRTGKITRRCIDAGLRSRNQTIRRRAQFLKNVLYRRMNEFGRPVKKRPGKKRPGKKVSRTTGSRRSVPKNKKLYAAAIRYVKSRVKVWPSAYASGQVVKRYKRMGGTYFIK